MELNYSMNVSLTFIIQNPNRLLLDRISINIDLQDQNALEFINATYMSYLQTYLGHYVRLSNIFGKMTVFDPDRTL